MLSPCSIRIVNWKSVIASKAPVVPFPPQGCFTQKGYWFGLKPSEEIAWRWRQAGTEGLSSMSHPVPCVPRGNLPLHCLRESTRGSHTSGVEQGLLCGPTGRKRHHALLIKSVKAVKSPEDRSPIGQKNSFGNIDLLKGCGKARVVAGWVGQHLWNMGNSDLGKSIEVNSW